MTATPTTTKLGPDQARLRAIMRSLADATSTEAPILSIYIDARPHVQGGRPLERNELTIVRDRLNEIAGALEPHTPARESIDADRERIEQLVKTEDLAGIEGLAIFACHHIGLWEAIGSLDEFETEVRAGPTAELFQLARLLDDEVSAVVAVVDTSTCRLFVTRRGRVLEREGIDEPSDEHKRHASGGWSQARYQRHVDMQDKRFAKEAAEAIERLVMREKPDHLILGGDERVIPILEEELSPAVRALFDHVERIDIHASPDDVRDEVRPVLAALEEAQGLSVADRAVAGWRAGDLGVTGIDDTMAALEAGQVDELVIDETVALDEDLRAELIRQAALTDAHVEVVRDHAGLRRREGVGATLRFHI